VRRRYRWLIAALVTIVALPIVAVIAALLWLDPNDLRAGAESSAREQLGLPLTLHGDLHWSWWPLFAIDAGAGVITDADGAPLLNWKRLQLGARWREMLNHEYLIDSISVDGLVVQLHRDVDGRGNWRSLFNRQGGSSSVHIRQLMVTDGALTFSDQQSGRSWSATNLKAAMKLGVDVTRSTLLLTQSQLTAMVQGSGLAASGALASMDSDRIAYNTASSTLEMTPLQLRIGNLAVAATLAGPLQFAPLAGAGTLELKSDSVRTTLTVFDVSVPPMRDAKVLGAAQASTKWQLGAETAAFNELRLRVDDTSLQGAASWPLATSGEITVDLRGDTLNADRYLRPADQPGEPFELPVKALRALKLRGSLALDTLTTGGVTARDTRVRFED
jgi:AsmA protein